MSDIFHQVLKESTEYKKILKSQPTDNVDFCEQKSLDAYFARAMGEFKQGKSELDLDIIYATYYDQWKRR